MKQKNSLRSKFFVKSNFLKINKRSQIYLYDILVALLLATVLFYFSVSHLMVTNTASSFVTLDEANRLLKFFSSTEVQDLSSVDPTINETLGLSIKERIVDPETTVAETILVLYYVNATRLYEFLSALDDYIFDEFRRFNYWISMSNSTDKNFFNHSNVADIERYRNSKEFTSSSILVTYGNLTRIYGPVVFTVTVWKNEEVP